MFLYIFVFTQLEIDKNMCKKYMNSFKGLAEFHCVMYLKSLNRRRQDCSNILCQEFPILKIEKNNVLLHV